MLRLIDGANLQGRRIWRKAYYARLVWSCIWGPIEWIACVIVLSLSHKYGEKCESTFGTFELWVVLFSARFIFVIPILFNIMRTRRWRSRACQRQRGTVIWINTISLVWFILGQIMFVFNSTCRQDAWILWVYGMVFSVLMYVYLVLSVVIFVILSSIHTTRRRERVGLSTDLLNDIPCRQWDSSSICIDVSLSEINNQNEDGNGDDNANVPITDSCSICRDDFVDGDIIRDLKCGHSYHRGCVDEWLLRKNTCPL